MLIELHWSRDHLFASSRYLKKNKLNDCQRKMQICRITWLNNIFSKPRQTFEQTKRIFFTFDKIRQRSMLRNYENMYPNGVYLLLQTKCQSFNSYLLEINSEAEQNWLMEESWLFHLFYFISNCLRLDNIMSA